MIDEFLMGEVMVEVTRDNEKEFLLWVQENTDIIWNAGQDPLDYLTTFFPDDLDDDPYCICVNERNRLYCHRKSSHILPIITVSEFLSQEEQGIEVSQDGLYELLIGG